jgi:hypothetical protein
MLAGARCRARKAGLPFNLTAKDVVIPEVCPALGVPLFVGRRLGPFSPTLDRIVPERGYVRGNIIVISNLANRIKTNAGSTEILAVGEWLKSIGA